MKWNHAVLTMPDVGAGRKIDGYRSHNLGVFDGSDFFPPSRTHLANSVATTAEVTREMPR